MNRRRSIRRMLATGLTLVAVAALAFGAVTLAGIAWFGDEVEVSHSLHHKIEHIVAILGNDGLDAAAAAMSVLAGQEVHVAIYEADGRIIAGGLPIAISAHLPLRPWADPIEAEFIIGGRDEGHLHGLAVTGEAGGRRLAIIAVTAVIGPRDIVSWLVDEFLGEILPVVGPMLAILLATGSIILNAGLRPLHDAARRAASIRPEHRGVRLGSGDVPVEVAPFVAAVDCALDRMEQAFEQQRRFTANAAHELRTPLSIMRARLDALPDGPDRQAMAADIRRMALLIDRLLAVARLDSGAVHPDRIVDLREVTRSAVVRIAPLAVCHDVEMSLDTPDRPVPIRADLPSLEDALRNLLENAIHYGADAGIVEVMVDAGGVVRVCDRGPGLTEEDCTRVFERFWRRPGDRAGSAGLGLAIVAETAAVHGGRVTAHRREGGGAEFRLDLPVVDLPVSVASHL